MATMTPRSPARAAVLAAAAPPRPGRPGSRRRAARPPDRPGPATDAKPADAKATAAQEPAAIPLPKVVPAAVEAYRSLAAIRAKGGPEALLDGTLEPLDDVAKAVEQAGEQFTRQPMSMLSDRDLVDFRQEMLRQDALLGRWSSRIEDAVRSSYGSLKELERMAAVWKLTEEKVAEDGGAAEIAERTRTVRKEIADLQKSVKAQLDKLLAAQDRVGSLRIRILGWLSAADRADAVREQQLFEIEAKPIWTVFSRAGRRSATSGASSGGCSSTTSPPSPPSSGRREPGSSGCSCPSWSSWCVVAWSGRRFARRAADDPELAAPAEVLAHPISAGLLVALSLTSWILPRAPAVFTEAVVLLMLPPFLRAHPEPPRAVHCGGRSTGSPRSSRPPGSGPCCRRTRCPAGS